MKFYDELKRLQDIWVDRNALYDLRFAADQERTRIIRNSIPIIINLLDDLDYLAEFGGFDAGPLELSNKSVSQWAKQIIAAFDEELD